MRIKYRLGLLYKILLFKIGLKKWLLKDRYGERILVFHGIDSIGETKYNSRFISKFFFEAFIKHISTHYNVISLDDFYAKKFKKNTLNIAITFDDGLLNNYQNALPILKKYKVPACFYITTIHEKAPYLWADFLDLVSIHTKKEEIVFQNKAYIKNQKNEFTHQNVSLKNIAKTITYKDIALLYDIFKEDWNALPKEELNEYWELMSPDQIKEIADHPLFTIGSHAETHASLINISVATAKEEILQSKKSLENICQQPIEEFAFPFGYYTEELAKYCLEVGYKKVLLVDYNIKSHAENEALKNRFVMNPYITLEQQLACLLKGSYF
ncbi:polysaccharide deacetylase family protein [Oceanihabitans sp. 2_MG-2023]|uniref:polysaccharide deacetylase family protein n=1 Tax=Oceanihabitans sp. 2_MG-2023 TaxID=3062661 RepID=UPI0026E41991|nr:polysaccharide deacetylase family protein [Oceanihabitans sp. 2_MG-2023]MDO6596414.1 polysaccharide deacetylase family protein [Oceanihabitans sp. 2_MG-2023]